MLNQLTYVVVLWDEKVGAESQNLKVRSENEKRGKEKQL